MWVSVGLYSRVISGTLNVLATENYNLILSLTKCDAWKQHSSASCEQPGEKWGRVLHRVNSLGKVWSKNNQLSHLPPHSLLQRPLDYLKELAIDQLSESAGQLPACEQVSNTRRLLYGTAAHQPAEAWGGWGGGVGVGAAGGELVKQLAILSWHLTSDE